jgi:hypothetical protein
MQRALTSNEAGAIPVGIGIDIGEAVPVEDGYRGNALNLGPRLCGVAAAGEILTTTVLVADDSVLFREGRLRVLQERGFSVIGQAGDADELLHGVDRSAPDVVVTDIRMPPTNTGEGLVAAQGIRTERCSAAGARTARSRP